MPKSDSAQVQDNLNVAGQQTVPNCADPVMVSNNNVEQAIKETMDQNELLGPVVAMDLAGDHVLLKFSRYETHLQRTLYRAMTELQKFQFLRKRNEAIDADNVAEASSFGVPQSVQ